MGAAGCLGPLLPVLADGGLRTRRAGKDGRSRLSSFASRPLAGTRRMGPTWPSISVSLPTGEQLGTLRPFVPAHSEQTRFTSLPGNSRCAALLQPVADSLFASCRQTPAALRQTPADCRSVPFQPFARTHSSLSQPLPDKTALHSLIPAHRMDGYCGTAVGREWTGA